MEGEVWPQLASAAAARAHAPRPQDAPSPASEFAEAVLAGLTRSPRSIPCRFFYDARGSELFEEITRLEE